MTPRCHLGAHGKPELPPLPQGAVLSHSGFAHKSRELRSSWSRCVIDGAQTGRKGNDIYYSLTVLSKIDQVAELHQSFTHSLMVLT